MWKKRNPTFAVTESAGLVTLPCTDSLIFKKQTKTTPKSSNALLHFISIEKSDILRYNIREVFLK